MWKANSDTKKCRVIHLSNPRGKLHSNCSLESGLESSARENPATGLLFPWCYFIQTYCCKHTELHGLNHLCSRTGTRLEPQLLQGWEVLCTFQLTSRNLQSKTQINKTVHLSQSNIHLNFHSFNEDIINARIYQVRQTLTYYLVLLWVVRTSLIFQTN